MSHNYSILDRNFQKKKINFVYKKIKLKDAKKYIYKYYSPEKRNKFNDFKKWINNKDGEFLISDTDDIIGFVMVDKNTKEISPLKIMEEYRGYGLGTVLAKDAVNMFNGSWLGVLSDNQIAIRLYKKIGFIIDKDKPFLKVKNGNVIFMKYDKNSTASLISERYTNGKLSIDKYNELLNYLYEKII